MSIIQRIPFTMQPQGAVGVASHLRSSLAYLWDGNSLLKPKFGQTDFVNTGGVTRVGRRGLEAYFDTNNYLLAQNYSPVVTSNGAFTGDFTAIIYAVGPTTGVRTLFSQRENAGNLPQFGITAGHDSSFGALAGSIAFATYNGGPVACNFAGGADGLPHVYAIRRIGTVVSGWIDGRMVASTTGVVQAIGVSTAGLGIGCAPAAAGTSNTQQTGVVGLTAAFNAGLSDGELVRIGPVVDRIYAPQTRRIWVPVSAGGGTTFTITPTGGITFGGVGVEVNGKILAVSGGVTFSGTGSATFSSGGTTYTITPTGGLVFAGSGVSVNSKVFLPTGGVSFAGSGLGLRTKVTTPSGGVLFGGTGTMTSNTSTGPVQSGERTKVGAGT